MRCVTLTNSPFLLPTLLAALAALDAVLPSISAGMELDRSVCGEEVMRVDGSANPPTMPKNPAQ
ncbi:hypothetical protein EMIHUDRAFT_198459 [Emiliania huxleyi CCMP1516]|uniref:Uncharacterized protein n=2 Tax=Emiliania huxleyi TaxID=2903 RepID=A0A0D3I7B4_EMIH1|nr:hypothetical protein EMIHUDRAFT_198459 [Emiliania huxleyi CCMP1516]EOD07149.1 hypothetical protein EMIHUDRAFT_198459 [Emiliania huxleyi CCMP1516]|eukprot:XP_005759578.1 hypothetical protein EMIHUDRAFT_198459 [Emiliania huxleyi CCMP1516]